MGILSQVHDLETTEEDISDQDQVIPHRLYSENCRGEGRSHCQCLSYDVRRGSHSEVEGKSLLRCVGG